MKCAVVVGLGLVAACGGKGHSSSGDAAIDSPTIAIDSPSVPSDSPIDSPIEIDAPPHFGHTHYVLDRIVLPTSATDNAFDVDGDSLPDNQVGSILATYTAQGYANQTTMNVRLARGEGIVLADLGSVGYSDDPSATFTLYQGADPMPPACQNGLSNCGQHLHGTGSFSIKPGAPIDPPLAAAIASGNLTADAGHLTVQFTIADSNMMTVTLIGARIELQPTATTLMGKIGGAITLGEITSQLLPGLRESYAEVVYRDCDPLFGQPPGCGCAPGSQGETAISKLDHSPADCGIALSEVASDPAITAMLAPDVMVEGQPALSIGLGVTAVPGAFVAPQ